MMDNHGDDDAGKPMQSSQQFIQCSHRIRRLPLTFHIEIGVVLVLEAQSGQTLTHNTEEQNGLPVASI